MLFLSVIFLLSCSTKKPECPESPFCTFDVRTVSVYLTDNNGNPFGLDSFYSFFSDNNSILLHSNEFTLYQLEDMRKSGQYAIAGDQMVSLSSKAGRLVSFTGYKDNKKAVERTFVIGHDCCHVVLRSGEQQIVIHQ